LKLGRKPSACLHAGSSFSSEDPPYAPVSETGTTSRRPRDRDQFALAADREPFVIGIDHHSPPIQAQRSKALAKKSRSTTSWPILACSFVTSASRPACASEALSSNALARFSTACRFHCVIWFG